METYGIEKLGIVNPKAVYRNLTPAQLTEAALRRGEGKLSNTGALVVTTGKYTGRSPKDKFIVDTPSVHDDIAWGSVNVPITQEKFNAIRSKVIAYLQNREIFIFDGMAGADPVCTRKFRIINELASQNLFIHELLIRPTAEELENYGEADFTIFVFQKSTELILKQLSSLTTNRNRQLSVVPSTQEKLRSLYSL